MPSTDSFTSSAVCVTSATAVTTDTASLTAFSQYNERGFFAKITALGVTVTKAATFGGSQSALTFPITRQEAISLANTLYRVAN